MFKKWCFSIWFYRTIVALQATAAGVMMWSIFRDIFASDWEGVGLGLVLLPFNAFFLYWAHRNLQDYKIHLKEHHPGKNSCLDP